MKNEVSLAPLIGMIILIVAASFGIIMIFSAFTIMSLNVLFVEEIVPLTWTTVFALSWLKFWLSLFLGGLIKVRSV